MGGKCGQSVGPPFPDAPFAAWEPRQTLRRTFDDALDGLGALGWEAAWLENPWEAAAAYMGRSAP